jgi:hypothetical protein
MHEFLTAALNFQSPELWLALDRQPALGVPTTLVKADRAVFDVPPMTGERIEALFRSIASPAQRRELKREGRVRFVYVFETAGQGKPLVGGFRVEAKGVNGRVVLLTCRNLRRYSDREPSSARSGRQSDAENNSLAQPSQGRTRCEPGTARGPAAPNAPQP